VALPLLGTIQATGLTTAELERTIGVDLVKAQLIRDPSVSVEVLAYRPIFALGEVNRPGQYAYQPGMIVVTAVAAAGASPIAPSRIARHRAQCRRPRGRGPGGAANICPAG
jgi:protein involved in polysaccharide export with SLBB domain